jgi:hypothetical protein
VEVVVIVGLPGSGKTDLIKEFEAQGYQCFDDMNKNWQRSTLRMLRLISQQRAVACSDIMFCTRLYRQRLERTLRVPIRWIFFENNPWQCAKNSLYRHFFEKRDRPLLEEIKMIRRLSRVYAPHGDVRPVVIAEAQGVHPAPKAKARRTAKPRFRQKEEVPVESPPEPLEAPLVLTEPLEESPPPEAPPPEPSASETTS